MDKQFKHLMLDIETLGTNSYAAIVSIGAVEFDIETGETGRQFHVKIDLQSSVGAGLEMDPSTVIWWLNQSKEAQNKLLKDEGCSLKEALLSFSAFCSKDYEIWGNSARFDCGILQNAYNKISLPVPWDFRKERCVRTLVSFKPEVRAGYKTVGVAHDALDDCHTQIGYCHEIWKSLKTD